MFFIFIHVLQYLGIVADVTHCPGGLVKLFRIPCEVVFSMDCKTAIAYIENVPVLIKTFYYNQEHNYLYNHRFIRYGQYTTNTGEFDRYWS